MEMLSHCTRQLSRCVAAAIPADQRSDTIDIAEAGFKMDARRCATQAVSS